MTHLGHRLQFTTSFSLPRFSPSTRLWAKTLALRLLQTVTGVHVFFIISYILVIPSSVTPQTTATTPDVASSLHVPPITLRLSTTLHNNPLKTFELDQQAISQPRTSPTLHITRRSRVHRSCHAWCVLLVITYHLTRYYPFCLIYLFISLPSHLCLVSPSCSLCFGLAIHSHSTFPPVSLPL